MSECRSIWEWKRNVDLLLTCFIEAEESSTLAQENTGSLDLGKIRFEAYTRMTVTDNAITTRTVARGVSDTLVDFELSIQKSSTVSNFPTEFLGDFSVKQKCNIMNR